MEVVAQIRPHCSPTCDRLSRTGKQLRKYCRHQSDEMKDWPDLYLHPISIQGRHIFTEGFGLAAHYVGGSSEAMGSKKQTAGNPMEQ